jgi:hypothetical protein
MCVSLTHSHTVYVLICIYEYVYKCRVGQFLGYCLWTGESVDMPLLSSVYSYILDQEVAWRDLMLDSPTLYKNYLSMLQMEPDDVEFMCQTMSVDDPAGNTVELVAGGADIEVTVSARAYLTSSSDIS